MEFVGPNNEEVTFTVILDARHGVKPRSTLSKIQKVVKKGKVSNFIIGGKRLGNTMYVVKQVSEFWDEIWNKGEIVRAKVDLTLEEYPEK
jgi:phage protein U